MEAKIDSSKTMLEAINNMHPSQVPVHDIIHAIFYQKLLDVVWVFKLKHKPGGTTLDRCKTRLVAKGFHQLSIVNFHETFSRVVKASTILIVLALVVNHEWHIRQLDINNIFLNGVLHEEVYIHQPLDFEDPTWLHALHTCASFTRSYYTL